jgi:hypothetical protein
LVVEYSPLIESDTGQKPELVELGIVAVVERL